MPSAAVPTISRSVAASSDGSRLAAMSKTTTKEQIDDLFRQVGELRAEIAELKQSRPVNWPDIDTVLDPSKRWELYQVSQRRFFQI